MMWRSDGENILKICLFISTESTNVIDGRTDGRAGGRTPHDGGKNLYTRLTSCLTISGARIGDVTVAFVSTPHPRKLMKELRPTLNRIF